MAEIVRKNRFAAQNEINREQAERPTGPNAVVSMSILEDISDITKNAKLIEIEPDELESFPDEKIRLTLHEGMKKQELLESIQIDGIMNPVLVWKKDNKNIILSGHNRVAIAKELGIKVPCYFVDVDVNDEERARRFVIISNIQNRQLTSMKEMEICHLFNNLIDSYHSKKIPKMSIYEEMSEKYSISGRSIREYIMLSSLILPLGELLDNKQITHRIAMVCCKKSESEQTLLYTYLTNNNLCASNEHASALRKADVWDEKTFDLIFKISDDKKNNDVSMLKQTIKELGKKYDINRVIEIIKEYY